MTVHPWPGPGWDPMGDLALIKQEMTLLFEQVLGHGANQVQPADGAWSPPADVSETKGDLRVQVELPGVQPRHIRIDLCEGVLTIRAERPPDPALQRDQAQQVECRYGSFVRRLTLPSPVDPERLRATYRDGVLDVRLPKPVGPQARRVAIDTA
jgi:HSP20 family protein